MFVWIDGGWDPLRCVGYASVLREGVDERPIVVPVLDGVASSLLCEYRALSLALSLTPDEPEITILTDSQNVVDQVGGSAGCAVLELSSYISWARRRLGLRSLEWRPRDQNAAHVPMEAAFDPRESWSAYELEALAARERKRSG